MGKKDSQAYRIRTWWQVAERWEVIYLVSMPFIIPLVFFQKRLGVPLHLRGFLFVALIYCVGTFFLLLVVLDRRAEDERRRRGNASWRNRIDEVTARQAAQMERRSAKARLEEATRRGKAKAASRQP